MTTRIILAAVGAIVALAGWMWRKSRPGPVAGRRRKRQKEKTPAPHGGDACWASGWL